MATDFVVMLPAQLADAVEVVLEALERLDSIEQALTIYDPNSEVSRVNRLAAEGFVKLSPDTFSLLQRSLRWSEWTDGAFDITAGPLVEAWGFTHRRGRKPTLQEIEAARDLVGYQHVELDADTHSIRFAKPGMSINLGAIGKGEALDRLASQLRDSGVSDFLLHGGNSSVVAAGDQTLGSGCGWAVGLAHPSKPRRRMAGLWLRDMALATSGSGKQFFHYQGRRYGHVIDPRTGYPAGDLMSLTVLVPSAADADACATGLFVAGSERIGFWRNCDSRHGEGQPESVTPMILVRPGRRQDEVEVESIGEISWLDAPIDLDIRRSG